MFEVESIQIKSYNSLSLLYCLYWASKEKRAVSIFTYILHLAPTQVRNKPNLHDCWGDVEIKFNRNQEVCVLVQVGNILSDLAHNLVIDGHSELETEYLDKEQTLISWMQDKWVLSLHNHLEPVVVNILEAELLVEAGLLRVGGEGAGLAAAGVRRGGGAHLQRHGDTPTAGDT